MLATNNEYERTLPRAKDLPDAPNNRLLRTRFVSNELLTSIVDVCYEYVLDAVARGRDWRTELSGVEPTLRSHVRQPRIE